MNRGFAEKHRERGFTLIELLAVMVLIGILMGILLPVLIRNRSSANRREVQATIAAVRTAIEAYHYDKRRFPVPDSDQGVTDRTYENNNWIVISNLMSTAPPYINMGDFKTNGVGSIVDPAGDAYVIQVDTDYDGSLPGGVRCRLYSRNWD